MTIREKYQYWEALSDYDMASAKVMIDNQRWLHVSVLCQQAAERLIKGMVIFHTRKEAPKSHNIPFLANILTANENFMATDAGHRFLLEKDEYEDFMIDLMVYLTNDYPFSYKKAMNRFITQNTAEEIYAGTCQLISWLKTFQA